MKISELVKYLAEQKTKHGDLDIFVNEGFNQCEPVNDVMVVNFSDRKKGIEIR
ncbi:hypothetical protein [Fangia hongkongensis]|uniref:hypothetical protein n=1 Tax=Fangia hongkongensis TaxID=270495 RepID=UPI000374641C|nr:hypothetical protein [Fangia hongkongensis]MBK2126252.1 hypothetical protein [Fangia hongkongensis]